MGLIVLSALLLLLGCGIGSQGWAWSLAWPVDTVSQQIFWDIRVPRNLGAWLGGALLGLSGAIAQGLFRNPLADPYLLGSSAGASLGVSLWLSAWGGSLFGLAGWERWGVTGAAFVGAMGAVALTLMLARGMQHTLRLLLAGVVVGVVVAALASLVAFLDPRMWQTLQAFMLGSVAMMDPSACVLLGLLWLVCLVASLGWSRVLDALNLGEDTALSLGMPLSSARWGLIMVLSLATGATVAQMGLMAFIGLAAPHAVRSTVRCTHRMLLGLSSLMGGVLLLTADILSRWVWAPEELPVGVLTAVLGGGYLLWRLQRAPGDLA
jgi:iron complex transport system permease protein